MSEINKNKIKYTIIIAAYNCSNFIGKCLESVVNQTYDNIEIIIVNDGSTDDTLKLLEKFKKKYDNIKILNQDNSGCVIARRNGLLSASGEFCLFVDSDDWIELNTIEYLNSYINNDKDIDIIKFRYKLEPSKKEQCMYDITEKDNNIIINTKNDKKFKRVYKDLIITSKYNNLCNEIFRKNLYDFDNPVFTKKINYGEDIIVNLSLFSKAKKILFTNDIFYHYFINDKSITNNINVNNIKKNIYDNIFLNEERIKYLNIYDIKDINEYMVRSRIVDFIYGQLIKYIINSKIINYDEIINCLDDNAIYRSITFDNDSLLLNGNIYEKSVKEAIINKKYVKLRFLLLLLKPVRIIKKIKK